MKHLDAPGKWLAERHRRVLMNKFCGRYLREKRLHQFIIYSDQVQDAYEHNRRLRNPATTAVQQAIHGLSYTIYGKPDVRRLMFEVFDFEQTNLKLSLCEDELSIFQSLHKPQSILFSFLNSFSPSFSVLKRKYLHGTVCDCAI
ncbi:ribonuclease III domain-containing protein RNC1 chloroplastic [Prunus yedoensis var. nudiflora]|uniref:Ribonuclease III domain-containing protein RNC1 chloroplastic n=1 Tax=Prunus yedoensis var. nudiflora TaxID=2094558 RepID=A0A314Z2W1_PRUYE|nr:ribonuclease III domain-containing protein RNC1 chloroplastic [Prunus yedoensis var. nudiflora]